MVTVKLAREWTDEAGVRHQPGSRVEIPESLLDDLVRAGLVDTHGDEGEDWIRWS